MGHHANTNTIREQSAATPALFARKAVNCTHVQYTTAAAQVYWHFDLSRAEHPRRYTPPARSPPTNHNVVKPRNLVVL